MADYKRDRDWEPFACLMALYANANTKNGKYEPKDFMPKKPEKMKKATFSEFKAFAEKIIVAGGGKVEK